MDRATQSDTRVHTSDDGGTRETKSAGRGRVKRPGALIRSLFLSRDKWKRKSMDRKVEIKRLENAVSDVRKSRERHKSEADEARERSATLQGELELARSRVEQLEREKQSGWATVSG